MHAGSKISQHLLARWKRCHALELRIEVGLDGGRGPLVIADLDVVRGVVVARLKLWQWPRHLSVSPDGRTLWVGLGTASRELAVVDVSDPVRPRLRGDEFYLQAKEMRPSLADRFIFITGFATDAKVALFLTKHDVKYLVKPFAIQGLINCVKQLLC